MDSDLNLNREHVSWPAPNQLAESLQSLDEAVRLRAMLLFGLNDEQVHEVVWSESGKPTGKRTVKPDLVRLTYAALGSGPTPQAVFSLQIGTSTFLAVATLKGAGWDRIAFSSMWSKYDMGEGDALAQAVRLRIAPDSTPKQPAHFELVPRASSGGTGTYMQEEAHFRVYQGELRNVLSIESEKRSCDPTAAMQECNVVKRWVVPATSEGRVGAALFEERGSFPSSQQPDIIFAFRELQNRFLHLSNCVFYKWDGQSFRYKLQPGTPAACRAKES